MNSSGYNNFMNEINLKGTRWFYTVDPSSLDSIDDLAEHLHSLLSSGAYIGVFPGSNKPELVETKVLVERINGLKIEIYSKEHSPPHFHVVAANINASFSLDNCTLIKGKLSPKEKDLIEYWFHKQNAKKSLIEVWNRTRTDNCVVGEYEEKSN